MLMLLVTSKGKYFILGKRQIHPPVPQCKQSWLMKRWLGSWNRRANFEKVQWCCPSPRGGGRDPSTDKWAPRYERNSAYKIVWHWKQGCAQDTFLSELLLVKLASPCTANQPNNSLNLAPFPLLSPVPYMYISWLILTKFLYKRYSDSVTIR